MAFILNATSRPFFKSYWHGLYNNMYINNFSNDAGFFGNKLKAKILLIIALLSSASFIPAAASVFCTDSVTDVVVHSNGRTFFTTTGSCSVSWCELAGDATFVNQGYAMLLAAKLKGKPLLFQWRDIANCDEKNKGYAVPEFMILR